MTNQDSETSAYSINCRGRLIDLSVPVVIGILNVTPDSFFDGGKFTEESIIKSQVEKMLLEGAQIIDVGAASSRPGAAKISEPEELKRLIPTIDLLVKAFPGIIISVDTFRSEVARQAINSGAHIINDISGGDFDPAMFAKVAELKVPYILMHMQGDPQTMQKNPQYKDVLIEVLQIIQKKVSNLRKLGVKDIIIDPGFGFGKNVEHNYELLAGIEHFHLAGCPVLAGISRKSMITRVLNVNPDQALNGTSILNTIALLNGAQMLRVHDVKEAMEAIRLVGMYKQAQK
jgi:dihydropteroate synthase